MSHELNDDDDPQLKVAFRAVEADAPLPDTALLDALRQRAAEAFAAVDTAPHSQPLPEPPVVNSKRRHPMVTLAIRLLCLATVAAAMMVALLLPMNPG